MKKTCIKSFENEMPDKEMTRKKSLGNEMPDKEISVEKYVIKKVMENDRDE